MVEQEHTLSIDPQRVKFDRINQAIYGLGQEEHEGVIFKLIDETFPDFETARKTAEEFSETHTQFGERLLVVVGTGIKGHESDERTKVIVARDEFSIYGKVLASEGLRRFLKSRQ